MITDLVCSIACSGSQPDTRGSAGSGICYTWPARGLEPVGDSTVTNKDGCWMRAAASGKSLAK